MQGHAKITISSEKNEMKAYDLDELTKMKSQLLVINRSYLLQSFPT